ncbi:MAG: rhomboid family intramembrane serine protease [Phycisphaerae bacterium]
MFPIGTDRPLRRTPWVNYLLIAANVVIYFISHGSAVRGQQEASYLLPWAQKLMLFPVAQDLPTPSGFVHVTPALFQYITYQFLHQDIWHLLGNMLFLYVFGNNLNEKLGHAAYLLIYLTGGIMAGCGQVLTSTAPTLGASGSISAITGLFFVLLPRANIRVLFWIFFYMDIWEIPGMWFILFSVAKDIVEGFFTTSSVAHWAHVSGNAAGVGIGLMLLFTGLVQRDHYDLLALIDRWRRRRQYESLVNKGYDPFLTPTPPTATSPVLFGNGRTAPAAPLDPRILPLREAISEAVRTHQIPQAVAKYQELRGIDPAQVMAAQDQLNIANQMMADGHYVAAAQAYEDYLRVYPKAPQIEQVELILGLVYARYVPASAAAPKRAAKQPAAAASSPNGPRTRHPRPRAGAARP